MKKLLIVASAMLAISSLSACSSDQAGCEAALAAFETAKTTCSDTTTTADLWFAQSACDVAADDGYDNTEFYECLTTKFEGTDVAITCETDADGNPTAVRQFEDTSESSDPAGCRELHDATAT